MFCSSQRFLDCEFLHPSTCVRCIMREMLFHPLQSSNPRSCYMTLIGKLLSTELADRTDITSWHTGTMCASLYLGPSDLLRSHVTLLHWRQ